MRVSGKLISVEHNSGTMKDRETGDPFPWENVTVKVFDGREVVVIKAKRDGMASALDLRGREGQDVVLDVDSPRSVDTYTLAIAQPAKA